MVYFGNLLRLILPLCGPNSCSWGAGEVKVHHVKRLVDSFARAAFDGTWEAAMDTAAESTGGVGSLLIPIKGHFARFPFSQSIGELVESYLRDGWVERDERYRGLSMIARRGAATDRDFMTVEEVSRHPYWQEFLIPHGFSEFVGVRVAAGDDFWVLSMQRSIKQDPIDSETLRQLASASERLSSAAAVARALGFARAEAAAAALDASGTAVVMIGRNGDIVMANAAAESLFSHHLRITGRRLVSWNRDATAALDRALHRLIWSDDGPLSSAPVILPRKEGRPVIAYPCRLPPVTNHLLAPAQAMVVLLDLERKSVPAGGRLMQSFGLTASEARLAAAVGAGLRLQDAASTQAISYETARTMLKQVMHDRHAHAGPTGRARYPNR